MAGASTDYESGAGMSFDGGLSEQQQSPRQSGEALVEWRSSDQVENGTPSTSPPYWDSDDGDDGGPKPSELYGKYTWKIDKFSQINKRELRSNAFEVGGYKWYILIYPQGCDVCNHLSLFLCVANHDKLLPGWSHFAQFTIAVVNKDPKKSKYSDTLHRFWKKEHDWGWKKFMELSKVMDGFIDSDTLIIKAQVQVIRERADRPFRCLDCLYRRELVRVYLTNVEQICRRFVEERRGKLGKLIEDKARWSSFCAFWIGMDQSSRRRMSRERAESILKVVVKHFFIEKEVTSTLVMDSLYSGLKALEGQNKGKKSKGKYLEAEELPVPIISIEKDTFFLVDDVLLLLERAAVEPLPPKDEKGPQNRTKDGAAGEEFSKDSIERDERRLTELGRRTIEIFVLTQIFSKIEVAYQEAVSLKRQEELIREEEASWHVDSDQKARRGADKEKKSKKKQNKQKKNSRKGKDKVRDEKPSSIVQGKIELDTPTEERNDFLAIESEVALVKSEVVEDVSDASDSTPEMLPLDSEGRDVSPVHWDSSTSAVAPPTEASNGGIAAHSGVSNGVERGSPSAVDDSSSTCSSDTVPTVVITMPQRGNSHHQKNGKSLNRERNRQRKATSEAADWVQEPRQPSDSMSGAGQLGDASRSLKAVEPMGQAAAPSLQDRVVNGFRGHAKKKEEETGSMHKDFGAKVPDLDIAGERQTAKVSPPRSPSKSVASTPSKVESKVNAANDQIPVKVSSSNSPKQADPSLNVPRPAENAAASKPETQKFATPKPTENSAASKLETQKLVTPKPTENSAALKLDTQKLATPKPSENSTGLKIETQKLATPKPTENSAASKLASQKLPTPKPTENFASLKLETQKFATPKPSEKPSSHQAPMRNEKAQNVPVTADKHSMPQIPVMSRPLSAPIIPGPRPSVPMVSAVQTVPVLARSVSATGRLGPEPTTSAAPSYVPHSYLNAIMGSSHATGNSSAYAQNHPSSSGINPPLSYAQPSHVSAPLFSGMMDQNSSNPSFSFRTVNNGTRWLERPQRDSGRNLLGDHGPLLNDMQSLHLYDPPHSRPQDPLRSEYPPGTSGRRNHAAADEFPHLDIINDLLDDDHVGEQADLSNSGYQNLSNGPHNLNRLLSFPGESNLCGYEWMQMYDDVGFQHGYGSSGIPYDAVRDMIPPVSSPRLYTNGQMDGLIHNQWQMGGSELPYMAVRNTDNDGYPYHHIPDYQNLPVGINGYTMFRPSNGL